MNKLYDKIEDIEQIAEMAQLGEDVSDYFTGHFVAKEQISIDFPVSLLRMIDAECQRLGITRQVWIKLACEESLQQVHENSASSEVAGVPVPYR